MDEHETLAGDPPVGQAVTEDRAIASSNAPIALSFFSGAMGLDLGLEQAGFNVQMASETDKDAAETIRKNRPDIPLIGDIHEHTAAQIRAAAGIGDADIDLVAGGAPCQSFSSAGQRRALDDVRGIAILKFASLAVELRPKYIVVENVRGLLSADGGAALAKVLAMLRDSGYAASFNLYAAAYFGAPQHRDRVIIIAGRDEHRVPHLAPTHSDRPEDGLPSWKTLRDAIGDMNNVEHHFVQFPDRRLEHFQKLQSGQNWRDLSEEDQRVALSEAVREAEGGKVGFYRRLAWDEPCPTLVSLPNMPATDLCHPEELRPLSVQEYKRIQGFPDHWEVCGNIESQYRQLGNAVPVLFGAAVGRAILEHMHTKCENDPAPGFRYSRYTGTCERTWSGCPATAEARLAELAPEIRRASEETKGSLLAAMQNVLPKVKDTGCLLMEAKRLCRKSGILWEPWVRENCGLSERSVQAYMRIADNWEELQKAQSSALLSIDGALKWLAQPKSDGTGSSAPKEPEAGSEPDGGHDRAAPVPAAEEEVKAEEPVVRECEEDDEEGCGEAATEIFDELMGAGQYFDDLAAVIAQSEWSRFERDVLHLEVTHLMKVLDSAASALASQGGLPRACALVVAYSEGNDKHEVRDSLARTIGVVRPALEWGEIQEVVTTAKFNADGVEAELL